MFNRIIEIIIKSGLDKIFTAIADYIQFKIDEKRIKKAVSKKIKEIKADPDRLTRAKRMKDFLETSI